MPRTRSLAWAQLRVGLLAIAGLVLAAVFIFMVGGQAGFSWQQYHLKTKFADVQGLKSGAVVRVAGVEVGTVKSIEFVGSDVEVVMSVSKAMRERITTDSRVSIGSLSLLGAPVLDISPSATGTPIEDWGYVRSRRPYGQLNEVAEAATRGLEQATSLLRDVRAGKGMIGKLFTDDALYNDLASFISSAEEVVAALNRAEGTIGKLIQDPEVYEAIRRTTADLSTMTARINAGEGPLGRLLRDDALGQSLSTTARNVEELTGKISRGEGTAGKLVNDPALYDRLNGLSEKLDQLAARLNAGEGTAGKLLQDQQLYENMNDAVSDVRLLIADIRREPKKYLNIKVSLF
jgi:phospholipid/cholesterol/gamma-HCH transport system substrate-binding protein